VIAPILVTLAAVIAVGAASWVVLLLIDHDAATLRRIAWCWLVIVSVAAVVAAEGAHRAASNGGRKLAGRILGRLVRRVPRAPAPVRPAGRHAKPAEVTR
jgi:hypothetical protein